MSNGQYQPLLDKSYFQMLSDWIELDWPYYKDAGEIEAVEGPYTPEYCRPAWTNDEATAYQVYEDVTEGTPISPVFQTREDLMAWLTESGMTVPQAEYFIVEGWLPSMIIAGGETYFGLGTAKILSDD